MMNNGIVEYFDEESGTCGIERMERYKKTTLVITAQCGIDLQLNCHERAAKPRSKNHKQIIADAWLMIFLCIRLRTNRHLSA